MRLRRQIARIPGVYAVYSRLRDWRRAQRFLAAQPAFRALREECRRPGPPVVIAYCEQSSHLQTVQDILSGLAMRPKEFRCMLLFGPNFPSEPSEHSLLRWQHRDVPRAALATLSAAVLLTPVVGLPAYYKPRGAALVHPLVSLTGLDGVYGEGDFDGCDYILCAGQHQIENFRRWRRLRRRLAGKTLVPAGYPKLDWTLRRLDGIGGRTAHDTIVYAPTHVYAVNEALCSLRRHGADVVRALLDDGWRVIFRPHPVSFSDEDRTLVEEIVRSHQLDPMFSLDRGKDYMDSYSRASMMVTDLSGTGFTYAFTFGRPVLFLAPSADAEAGLGGIQFEARERIGGVVRSLPALRAAVRELQTDAAHMAAQIHQFRDSTIFNLGTSADYVVGHMGAIVRRDLPHDWARL